MSSAEPTLGTPNPICTQYYSRLGHLVMAGDESSHMGWNVKDCRYPRGMPATTPAGMSRERFHSFGTLYDGGFYCRFYDKPDEDSFCDFLAHLHDEFGRMLLFADNTAYHKSFMVMEELEKFGGDVVLRYFPAYTPELNPIAGHWRIVKKHTGNKLHDGAKDMRSIRRMISNGEINVAKMSSYLTV